MHATVYRACAKPREVKVHTHHITRQKVKVLHEAEMAKQLHLFCLLAAVATTFRMVDCELGEQCEFVYGGLVYPEGRPPSVEHGLHWSKTQSECVGV